MSLIGRTRYAFGDPETEVRVTREQLFELAWSAPMRTLAEEFGISDVSLAKALRLQGIALPDRGYWAKLQAGKAAMRERGPVRQPGQDRLVVVHGALAERFRTDRPADDDPQGPFSSSAVPEDLLALHAIIMKRIGKVPAASKDERFHRALHALLRRDERRRAKIATSTWPDYETAPVYDAPEERRRLALASRTMIVLERLGFGCQLYGPEPGFSARVGDHDVVVRIYRPGEKPASHRYDFHRQLWLAQASKPPVGKRPDLIIGSPDQSQPCRSAAGVAKRRLGRKLLPHAFE